MLDYLKATHVTESLVKLDPTRALWDPTGYLRAHTTICRRGQTMLTHTEGSKPLLSKPRIYKLKTCSRIVSSSRVTHTTRNNYSRLSFLANSPSESPCREVSEQTYREYMGYLQFEVRRWPPMQGSTTRGDTMKSAQLQPVSPWHPVQLSHFESDLSCGEGPSVDAVVELQG